MSEPAQKPLPDPLIDEVRAVGRAMLEECDNDLDTLIEQLREIERRHPERMAAPNEDRARRR